MKINIEEYKDVIQIEINNYDLHNLDQILAIIICEAIKKFKDNPGRFFISEEHLPKELHYKNLNDWGDEHKKRSDFIFEKMIYSFEEIKNGNYKEYDQLNEDYMNKIKDGLDLFSKYFISLWK